jgi:hypothetical protein
MYLLDDRFRPAPAGVQAEIYIGGHGLARNYLNHSDSTAEKFIPNPYPAKSGERLYRTGDLGRHLADGKIEYTGRIDHQVKIRGFRVELGEIESHLRTHAGVSECVVIAHNDGTGEKRLAAYVVCEGEREPGVHELRDYLKGRLPEYMLPARFIRLERMPLTPSGKVDRRALPAPERSMSEEIERSIEQRSPVEEIVIGIFEDVLMLERVGRKDNFFDLGGHSLLVTQVISRVRKMSGVEIELRSIFEEPTAEGLSRKIEEAMRAGEKAQAPPLTRIEREGARGRRYPLSFAQQRLWFIDQLNPDSAAYNISGAMRLEGNLDLDALERSVNEIVRRHEILRTRIEVEADEPAQVIDAWEPRKLEVVDLIGVLPLEKEEEVARNAGEEAGKGFDLSRGPLLRVKVLRLEEQDHVLLYTMSHIVSDGWSMGIMIGEVETLYRAYSMGSLGGGAEESPLEDLPIQYADYAVWQREWLKDESLEEKLKYWRKQLEGMEDLELPADHPRPAVMSYRGAIQQFVVERALVEKLRGLSQREGVTLFMTLLAGFDVLMSRYSGQEDVTIGTDIANRNRAEIEGLIGFFVNQLALRVAVRAEESFGSLLKRVRETCLGAYTHQDLPFEKLVEELRPERELSRSPLFQVKLILQNAPNGAMGLQVRGLLLVSN